MLSIAKPRACAGEMTLSAAPSSSIAFFDTKQEAVARAKAHPHFMTVRILTPGPKQGTKLVAPKNPSSSSTNIASTATASWRERPNELHQDLNLYWTVPPLPWPSSFLQYARGKT